VRTSRSTGHVDRYAVEFLKNSGAEVLVLNCAPPISALAIEGGRNGLASGAGSGQRGVIDRQRAAPAGCRMPLA